MNPVDPSYRWEWLFMIYTKWRPADVYYMVRDELTDSPTMQKHQLDPKTDNRCSNRLVCEPGRV